MNKKYFAIGLLVTVLGIWGAFNPLTYINTIGRLIEPIIMDGTTGSGGFVALLILSAVMMVHGAFIIRFWMKVARRIQEVLAD